MTLFIYEEAYDKLQKKIKNNFLKSKQSHDDYSKFYWIGFAGKFSVSHTLLGIQLKIYVFSQIESINFN